MNNIIYVNFTTGEVVEQIEHDNIELEEQEARIYRDYCADDIPF